MLVAAVALLAINGVRVQQGRDIFYTNSGLGSRISALGSGLFGGSSVSDAAMPGVVAQFASREAGVDFAGSILQSMSEGQPRLSASYVPESLLLPSRPGFDIIRWAWRPGIAYDLGIAPWRAAGACL